MDDTPQKMHKNANKSIDRIKPRVQRLTIDSINSQSVEGRVIRCITTLEWSHEFKQKPNFKGFNSPNSLVRRIQVALNRELKPQYQYGEAYEKAVSWLEKNPILVVKNGDLESSSSKIPLEMVSYFLSRAYRTPNFPHPNDLPYLFRLLNTDSAPIQFYGIENPTLADRHTYPVYQMEMGGKVSVDDFRRHPQTPLKQLKVPRDEKKTAAAVHGSGAQIVNIMNNIHRAGESMPSTVIRMVADSYNGSAMQYASYAVLEALGMVVICGPLTIAQFIHDMVSSDKVHMDDICKGKSYLCRKFWRPFLWSECHITFRENTMTQSIGSKSWRNCTKANDNELTEAEAIALDLRMLVMNDEYELSLYVLLYLYCMSQIVPGVASTELSEAGFDYAPDWSYLQNAIRNDKLCLTFLELIHGILRDLASMGHSLSQNANIKELETICNIKFDTNSAANKRKVQRNSDKGTHTPDEQDDFLDELNDIVNEHLRQSKLVGTVNLADTEFVTTETATFKRQSFYVCPDNVQSPQCKSADMERMRTTKVEDVDDYDFDMPTAKRPKNTQSNGDISG